MRQKICCSGKNTNPISNTRTNYLNYINILVYYNLWFFSSIWLFFHFIIYKNYLRLTKFKE